MKRIGGAIALFLLLSLCQIFSAGSSAQAAEVIRNGTFDAGLSQWNKNPALPAAWNPLASGAVDLHPAYDFTGDVVYQNLNVTGIAGTSFSFSCSLWKIAAPTGNTVAIYADYLDNAGKVVSQLVSTPSNDSIGTAPQTVTATLSFPATAVRFLKLRIAKENSGQFLVDNVSCLGSPGAVGVVPVISSLSSASGPYGGQFTITGSGFGASAGTVGISGSSGLQVNSWSDTSVTVTLDDPARSGLVLLKTSGKVESNADLGFSVTSPNFTCDPTAAMVQVVRGQPAEFVLATAFLNGFASSGVSFTVSGLPAGASYAFAPVPLTRPGGVVLKVETAALPAGSYDLTIQANSAGMAPRSAAARLVVATTSTLGFYQNQTLPVPPYYQQVQVQSPLNVSAQGNLSLVLLGKDSAGLAVSGIQLASGNPQVVGVYRNSFGYDVYVHNSGSATLTATAPDGTQATLEVAAALPATSRVDINIFPQQVTNTYSDPVQLSTSFTFTAGQWYLATGSSMITTDSTLDFNSFPPPYYYGGQFKIDQDKTPLGSYLFGGAITNGYGGGTLHSDVASITITNDPSYAGLNVTIKSLDRAVMSQMYEYFDIEFHDPATGALLFKRSHSSFTLSDTNFIGAIPPGTYKLCMVPMSSTVQSNWYPNASTVADALPVTFLAGAANDRSLYFFAKAAPDTTAPLISSFDVNGSTSVSATSLTVTGINIFAWDFNGVTGYCLTEANDAATCSSWSPAAPTQYSFATPGVKQLYVFARDAAGNIGGAAPLDITIISYALTLNFAGTGDGTVMGDLTCGTPTCAPGTFASGSTATLIAVPNADSTARWTGCSSVTGSTCKVDMNSPMTVTLTFDAIPPVRILRTGSTYASIMAAYAVASHLDCIQTRTTLIPLTENLTFNKATAPTVTLEGGRSGTFGSTPGFSTVKGTLKVSKGKVIAEKIKMK